MQYLKIYDREREKFKEYWDITIDDIIAEKLISILAIHFAIQKPRLEFTTQGCGMAHYSWSGPYIKLPRSKRFKLGIFIHEFTHILAYVRDGRCGHNKIFWDWLHVVYGVADEKNFIMKCNRYNLKREEVTVVSTPKKKASAKKTGKKASQTPVYVEMYKAGKSVGDIGKETNRTSQSVRAALIRAGVKMRTAKETVALKKKNGGDKK